MWTLRDLLEYNAEFRADRVALVMDGRELTYAELLGLSGKFANALLEAGLRPGDRVAVVLPNCIEYVALLYGATSSCMILVPVNPLLKPREMAYILSHSGARAAVTIPQLEGAVSEAAREAPSVEGVLVLGESEVGNWNLPPRSSERRLRFPQGGRGRRTSPSSSTPRAPPASLRGPC